MDAKKFYRRVAIFIPYNEKGEILLQHRTDDAPHYPGFWGFFGGGIDEGETPEDAVDREAMEELRLDLSEKVFFKRYEIQEEKGLYERNVFLVPTTLSVEQLRNQQHEGQDLDFFTFEGTHNLKFNNYARIVLKDVTKYLQEAKQE